MPGAKPIFYDFRVPRDISELARYLGWDATQLELLATNDYKEHEFFRLEIPKRNSKRQHDVRIAWQIPDNYNDLYKTFGRRFDRFVRVVEPRHPRPYAFGYLRGRGTLDNAAPHCGAKYALKADIQNFFPSISEARLQKLFTDLKIHADIAPVMASLCSIEGALPLGFPASPMLANIVCLDIDDALAQLAHKYNCTYTRYADDITISGNDGVPPKKAIEKIVGIEGFKLSEDKFRVSSLGQTHYVTGLSISDPARPHAPREMKRRLRQELYYCKKYGVTNHIVRDFKTHAANEIQRHINRLDGMVHYVSHIERDAWPTLRDEWKALEAGSSYESYSNNGDEPREFTILGDETEFKIGNKNYLALAIVQTESLDLITATTVGVLRQYYADPFSSARKKSLEKKGIHFTDVDEDIKKAYIEKLITLPYRCYLAFSEMPDRSQYEQKYLSLISKIMPHRFMACDAANVTVVMEQNDQIDRNGLEAHFKKIYKKLTNANNRSPEALTIKVAGKLDYPSFSVPDFMLAMFSHYAQLAVEKEPQKRRELLFESLRDKYRVIYDADTNIPYTRKRPFTPDITNR